MWEQAGSPETGPEGEQDFLEMQLVEQRLPNEYNDN